MGDRSGLPRIDRTNGFDDGRDYMRVKKNKLALQNDSIREALRHRNSSMKSDLFKGVSIHVNGRTQPSADELKRLILLNGGDYHPYYRYQTTKFMIATNLSAARIKTLRPDDRVVRPEWVTDSVQVKCLLPYEDYELFVDEPRGKNAVLATNNQSRLSALYDVSASTSTVGKQKASQKPSAKREATKSRDIREMFACVKSLDKNGVNKKKF